jgi:hypothetical protein
LVTLKNLDLVAKNGHLKLQVDASSEAGKEAAEDGNDDLAHDLTLRGMAPNSEDFWAGWDLWKGQARPSREMSTPVATHPHAPFVAATANNTIPGSTLISTENG